MGIRVFHRTDGSFVVACGGEVVVVYPGDRGGGIWEGGMPAPLPTATPPRPKRLRPVPGGPGPMALMVIGGIGDDPAGHHAGMAHVDLHDLSGKFARQSILGETLYGQAETLPTGMPMIVRGTIAAGQHFDVGRVARHFTQFQTELGRPVVVQVMHQDDDL
jgi:hypothetical protein